MTRIFIAAGEASGDQHAAALVDELRRLRPGWSFAGLGGDRLAASGVALRANLVERSVMGVRRVVTELGHLLEITAGVLEEFRRQPPAALILVDYPGLNLNLARMARRRGIPVIYYICPQVWAWAPWRLRRIAARADRLLVVLPFEEQLYRSVHPDVHYVENPVFDHLARIEATTEPLASAAPLLALFPGSRRQEVEEALPIQLRVAQALLEAGGAEAVRPAGELVVSCHRARLRPAIDAALAAADCRGPTVHEGSPHALQRAARLSLVVSGTASLEHAYFGTPMVVVYPVRRWERCAFSVLSVTPFIALANLFAGRRLVPEFLVAPGEEPAVTDAARELWEEGPARAQLLSDLRALRREAFLPGGSRHAAERVVEFLGAG